MTLSKYEEAMIVLNTIVEDVLVFGDQQLGATAVVDVQAHVKELEERIVNLDDMAKDSASMGWTIADVYTAVEEHGYDQYEPMTDETAMAVLDSMEHNADFSLGVGWEDLYDALERVCIDA